MQFDHGGSLDLLGCPCQPLSRDAARNSLADLILKRQKGFTCAINTAKICLAGGNVAFSKVVNESILTYPDGVGAVLALKALHGVDAEKVDLQATAIELCAEYGRTLVLLGGEPGVHLAAEHRLMAAYPTLNIVPGDHGYRELDEYVLRIKRLEPSVVFLGLGSPKQEWMASALMRSCSCLVIPCGGAIDVLAGKSRRAPSKWREKNLEWLWRVMQEPKRFPSAAGSISKFLCRLAIAVWLERRSKAHN